MGFVYIITYDICRNWTFNNALKFISMHKWTWLDLLESRRRWNDGKNYSSILSTLHIAPRWFLTHWGRDEIDAIVQTTFSNAFSWMKMYQFSLRISLKFVPKFQINNIPALVQIMAWRRPGDKPLSEPMIVVLLTHICVTRPQWVKLSINTDLLIDALKLSYTSTPTTAVSPPTIS